jgi:hypothetical protein
MTSFRKPNSLSQRTVTPLFVPPNSNPMQTIPGTMNAKKGNPPVTILWLAPLEKI